ncbi:MAG TPA: SDR family oxidoreductase [Actinomycetota bacterium]|nr:SDR family oxidoreductase [Actinomycetota bacterium]
MGRFDDLAVLVTGASSGIGAATLRAFVAEGARVAAAGRSTERLADVRASSVDPDRVTALSVDLGEPDAGRALVADAIAQLGGLDVVVNNAGVAIDAPVLDTSDEVWRSTLAVNLDAAFEVAQAAARHMVECGGGAIVNVASTDALVPEAPLLAYNVSKAGLIALTRTFALELGHRGVRVNAVAPGQTLTPMTEGELADPAFRRAYLAAIPALRAATSEEIAAPILFLASSDASYVNGTTLVVDGGQLAGTWYYPWDRPEPEDGS